MNQELYLKILGQVMSWDDNRAREEFKWLRLMARLKYDGYRDFHAGVRFIESLITWVQQFDVNERETAYDFVRRRIVYVGPGELQRLVELFFPSRIYPYLTSMVASQVRIPKHQCLANSDAQKEMSRLQRQTLFMGLSDGARIDILRHANVGVLTNDQFVLATQVDKEKWADLLEKLTSSLQEPTARFRLVCLLDDFVGTGTTFLRYEEDKWKGKLLKFKQSVGEAIASMGDESPFADDWHLCIHHYIAGASAAKRMAEALEKAKEALEEKWWAKTVHLSFGMILPEDLPIDSPGGGNEKFIELTNAYYDPKIETKHTDVGGVKHMGLGYGKCALPVILEHNTPNNSVALLWAETEGDASKPTPAMRPLFRRRQRHT